MRKPGDERDWWTLAELLEPWWQLLARVAARRGHPGEGRDPDTRPTGDPPR